MKKFLLSLASVVMFASAASATTVYFENTANWDAVGAYCWAPEVKAWPGTAVTTTIEASGRTFYAYEVPGSQENIIFNNNVKDNTLKTKDLKVVDGAVYSAANATSIDPIGSIANGVFTPAGEVVIEYATIYVPVSDWDKAECNIYTWDPNLFGGWPGSAMTKTTVNDIAYWSIKIDKREIDGVKVGGWKLNGDGSESDNVTNGTVFKDGFAYSLDGTSTEVGGGDDPQPGVTPLYVCGSISNWATSDAYKMTGNAAGEYTIHLDKLTGEFKITTDVVNGTWNDNLTFSAQTALNLGQEYECESAVPMMSNMSVAGLGATDVTVNFNINTKMIKVTGTPIEEVVTKYFIKGNFRDLSWPSVEMVQGSDNLYHATIIPHEAECNFIVYKTNDDVEAGWYKGATAVVGETVTLQNDKGGNATVTLTPLHTYDFVFNPETLELTVDQTSGVADIEAADELPAVYYNLQGVRVANPENGLYLEVRGNNVRKVVK